MELKDVVTLLKRNKAVTNIIQFGSSLTSASPRDIDLCIMATKKLTLKQKLQFQRNLSEQFDINFYEDLPLNLKKEALTTGKILFTRDYYALLKELMFVNDEFVRYQRFLEDYHQQRMASL